MKDLLFGVAIAWLTLIAILLCAAAFPGARRRVGRAMQSASRAYILWRYLHRPWRAAWRSAWARKSP